MGEFFSKLGNGLGLVLIAGAVGLVFMMFLKSSKRNASAGDYVQRVKAQKANTKEGNNMALLLLPICFICFLVTSGTLRWVSLGIGILLIAVTVLPNLFKNNSKEYQQDLRKYTKYKHQLDAQTSGAKGMAVGAASGAAGGALTGAAVGSIVPGVGTAIGAGVGAVAGLAGGMGSGHKIGKSTKEVHNRRADVMTDVKEDFSNTIDEEMLEAGTKETINTAQNVVVSAATGKVHTGTQGSEYLQNVGQNTIEAYKKQGMSDEQIAAKVQSDIESIEQHNRPSFMSNTKAQPEPAPSFMSNTNVVDAEYREVADA